MKNWKSLQELFDELNDNCLYVVLRNFEDFNDLKHLDIDFLTSDREKFIEVSNSVSRTNDLSDLVHQKVMINNNYVPIDIRTIGDGYYDEKWEKSILNKRIIKNNFYIPSDDDYLFSLIYHVLVHKNNISEDYKVKLKSMNDQLDLNNISDLLNNYMKEKEYYYTYPETQYTIFNVSGADKELIEKNNLKKLRRYIYKIKSRIKR